MSKILSQRTSNINAQQLPATLPPLLRKLYALRGIGSEAELSRTTQSLLTYHQLNNLDLGVQLVYQAMLQQKHILVVGDFDTDGATSTALLVSALRKMGARQVSYIIPDRFEEGYGLSVAVVERALECQAELIITVDNGISSHAAVDFAHQHGLLVIITDHHLPPDPLPPADAIINPNLTDCEFPSKALAGVGVAFYFSLALRALLRKNDWFTQQQLTEYNLVHLLDLVALGTVADVVNLDHNNRILVYQGLQRIRAGFSCTGIKALIAIAQKKESQLSANDLGFFLAPRINAAGRMETMTLGVELLLSQDYAQALTIANQLDELNSERRHIEQLMQKEALAFITGFEQQNRATATTQRSLVIYDPNWHQGIIGILSARIKDRFYRPVISFAATQTGYLKGSGRSIQGFHLRDALERIDNHYPDLITSFGGHAMAAGLTIKAQDLPVFTDAFHQTANQLISDDLLNHVILSDGQLEANELNLETVQIVKEGGPWGAGFPEPLFDGEFFIHQQRLLAGKHLKLVLEPVMGGPLLNGIAFNIDTNQWPDQSIKSVKLAYNLEIDDFRGNQSIQLLIRDLWPQA